MTRRARIQKVAVTGMVDGKPLGVTAAAPRRHDYERDDEPVGHPTHHDQLRLLKQGFFELNNALGDYPRVYERDVPAGGKPQRFSFAFTEETTFGTVFRTFRDLALQIRAADIHQFADLPRVEKYHQCHRIRSKTAGLAYRLTQDLNIKTNRSVYRVDILGVR